MPTEGGAPTDATAESPFRPRPPIDDATAEAALRSGDLEPLGRMPWSSNATLLVDVSHGDLLLQGVYKPGRGERPLHDFPPGLFRREAAAWELARQLGWGLIPPTVVRDGPLGEGSVQLYVPCDYDQHFFTLRDDPAQVPALRRLAAFDLVANNTDRKGGHVLLGDDGEVWAVDNALCFHHQFKGRAGRPARPVRTGRRAGASDRPPRRRAPSRRPLRTPGPLAAAVSGSGVDGPLAQGDPDAVVRVE